jgi:hypothetical protein
MSVTNDLSRLANNANVIINSITVNSTAITSVNVAGITINSSGYTGDANNAAYLGGSSLSTIQGQITSNASSAYSNSVTYTDTKIGTANSAIIANASAAYSNATSYTDTKIGTANSAIVANASAAYSNSVSYVDTKIGTANSAITGNAATAYTNAVSYTDTKIGTANSAIVANASAAYTNATVFASNATNVNTGTLAEARLPYCMNQNVRNTDTVEFGGMTLTGNLVVSGNVNIIGANNLSVSDNMIYLNSNNDVSNPDIGIAGNYNDGTYAHTGIFRDATDGIWKVFDNYGPEPDASPYIDTSNTSFRLANFQANNFYGGNTTANWFVANTSGAYTTLLSGNVSSSSYVSVGNSTVNVVANSSSITFNSSVAAYASFYKPSANGSAYVAVVGSNNASNPYWNGWQFVAPGVFANSSAGNAFPRTSHFYSFTSTSNPSDLYYNIQAGNDSGIGTGIKIYAVSTTNSRTGIDISANGNVGIGTTSPSSKLNINSSTNDGLKVTDGTVTSILYNTSSSSGSIGTVSNHTFNIYSNNTIRASFTNNGDLQVGNQSAAANTLRYFDLQNTDTGVSAGAIMRFITANSSGGAATTVDMVKYKNGSFYINNNDGSGSTSFGTAGTQRLYIGANGNVGVSTTSPAYALDVNGIINSQDQFRAYGGGGDVRLNGNYAGNTAVVGTVGSTGFGIMTSNDPSRLWIASGGNVGINTKSPLGKFTVRPSTDNTAITLSDGDPSTGAWIRNDGSNMVISTNVGEMYYGYSGSSKNLYFMPGGGSSGLTIGTDRVVYAPVQFRSPVIYDYDDTTYYIDPNSSSKISGLITFNTAYGSSVLQDGQGFVINGNYTNGYYSHRFRKWDDGNGVPLYVQYTTGTIGSWSNIAKFGPGGNGETAQFSVFGYGYASGSWRAPVFYDSDDTGYYIDPNSTSDQALRIRGGAYFGPNASWNRYLWVGTNGRPSDEASVCATDGNLHIDCKSGNMIYLNYYSNANVYQGGSGFFYSGTSIRAPIFYDTDDTAYYANLAGASRLSGIQSTGRSGNWDSDFQNTPADSFRYGGDLNSGTNCPTGGGWWVQQNFRHSNSSNYWGVQVAWGWEDKAHELYTRNITGNSFSSWIRYSNSNNGGSILIADLSASGASTIESTTCFNDSTYKAYEIQFQVVPGSMSAGIYMQFYVGGAWRTAAGDYRTYSAIWNAGGSQGYGPNSYIDIGCGGRIRNYAGITGIASIVYPSRTDTMPIMTGIAGAWDSTIDGGNKINFTGLLSFNSAISGFRIYASSGTISGYVKVYGRK